jgi:pilus assembly protein CpaB
MKLPAVNRSWVILAVALIVGGAAAFGVNRYIKRQVDELEARGKSTRTVRVVVPKADMPRGTPVTSAAVAVREVPAEWAHSNAITPEQFDRVENQRLAYPAAGGEMLLWSLLEGQRAPTFSSRLGAGRRAITVPVDDVNSISGMLEPGDRIDLVVSVKRDRRTVLFPLLQNVSILATGTRAAPEAEAADGKPRTFTTITLEASPEDAQRVLAAREIGKVAALLRAPGDSARTASTRRDAMALLGIGDDVRPTGDSSVPVLYGGNTAGLASIAPLRAAAAAVMPPDTPVNDRPDTAARPDVPARPAPAARPVAQTPSPPEAKK